MKEDFLRQSVEVLLFLFSENQNRELKKEEHTMEKKEYSLYVKGKGVPVSEEVYKAYWKITEHEKYLIDRDRKSVV